MAQKRAKVPSGLGPRGSAFYREIVDQFEGGAGELAILLEASRVLDRLDALDRAIAETGPTSVGSTGQMIPNPLLGEARQQAVVLHRLVSALDIEDEGVPSATSTTARRAANRRWTDELSEARLRRGGA